jgi:hypothetical protein
MRKITSIILIILSFIGSYAQKKNVDAASKLVGTSDGLTEARNLLKEAMANEQTKNDSRTYFVAGLNEWRSYDNDIRKLQINPKDGSVTNAAMSDKILNGYSYFVKAISLDSLPDKKGKVKPRYTKEILGYYDQYAFDIYRAGVIKYKDKKYYPEAYIGFMTAAELAENPAMTKAAKAIPDSLRAESYYYAGISAYTAQKDTLALDAFHRAINTGCKDSQAYLYIMAIWENRLAGNYSNKDEALDSLYNVATRGYAIYGIENTTYLQRIIEIDSYRGKQAHALELLNEEVKRSPNVTFLYGQRAWIEEELGMDEDALVDYRKAAEMKGVTSYTLLRGAHKLYRMGAERKKNLSGTAKQIKAQRKAIVTDFFEPAMELANRAKSISKDSKEQQLIDNLIENIDFDLSIIR